MVALKPLLDEFAGYLDRSRFDVRLQIVHQLLVALGMVGCLIAVGYHFGLEIGGEHAPAALRNLLLSLTIANLTGCTIAVLYGEERALRRLQADARSLEQRAARVGDYIFARGRMLLVMALVGQGLVWLAAGLGIRLLSIDAPLVILNLLPTVQQMVIGLLEIPNRKRLMTLYKLVALYHERARIIRERGLR